MGLIEKVKSLVGEDDEDQTYLHQCQECRSEFETPVENPNDAVCPECGSDRVAASPDTPETA